MRRAALALFALGAAGVACRDGEVPPPGDPPSGWVAIGGATDRAPAATQHEGTSYVFVRGATGDVRFASSEGDRTWSAFQPIVGLATDASPAAASFGGAVHVFARSASDGRVLRSASDSGTFDAWEPIADLASETAPAAVSFGGRLFVFTVAADHGIQWSSTVDGSSWSTPATRGDRTSSAPAPTVVDGTLVVLWVDDADGGVRLATSADGEAWTSGEPLAPPGRTSAVSAGTFGHDLVVTIVDADTGRPWSNVTRAPLGAPRWGGWFEIPPRDRATDVAVATVGFDDGVRWFARDLDDGSVYETRTPTYHLPFASGEGWSLATGNVDDPVAAHGPGDYSFDLAHAEDGTSVLAMRDGNVVLFENDETCSFFEDWQCLDAAHCCSVVSEACLGDDGPKLGNVVLIQHDDGSVASYNHLAPRSIPDAVRACGARVRRGDVVGSVGHTGAVCGPSHVHVGVLSGWSNANGACAWGGRGYPDRTGVDLSIPMLPIHFTDAHHAAWRPVVGDALSP